MREPANADHVEKIVQDRLDVLEKEAGTRQETVTVEWRTAQLSIPVIVMPVDVLTYNPDTQRVQAQRSLDPDKERNLDEDPFGSDGQAYLHSLLRGNPADPTLLDPTFTELKENLKEFGQKEPGVITRAGMLINGNTRRAACKELGVEHLRVGVLPADAAHVDLRNIELSLQLRKEYKRDYSPMNRLLAIDKEVKAGRDPSQIQKDFHIVAKTFARDVWILDFVREVISRSEMKLPDGTVVAMRLTDFERDKAKLEEFYNNYTKLKQKSSDQAEKLKENCIIGFVYDRSKTDLRIMDSDFSDKYMKVPSKRGPKEKKEEGKKVPGTSITATPTSDEVVALRARSDEALKRRAILQGESSSVGEKELAKHRKADEKMREELGKALDRGGKTVLLRRINLGAQERLTDAKENIELAVEAVVKARASSNFDPGSLDSVLTEISEQMKNLAQHVNRADKDKVDGDGLKWLRKLGSLD